MSEPVHPVHVDPVPREAREFQGQRAGVVTRTAAGAVDYAIAAVAVLATYVGVAMLQFLVDPRDFVWPTVPFLGFVGLGWLYLIGYLTIAWAITGRSFGARLMGVRVVNFRGRRMRFGPAMLRAVFCVGFSVGLFWCAINRSNRSVQDIVLRTSVIHDWSNRPGVTAVEVEVVEPPPAAQP